MTNEQKETIRELQKVLRSIENKTPIFFNLVQYKNLGLVTTRNKFGADSSGNKINIGYIFHLTEKKSKTIFKKKFSLITTFCIIITL